MQRQEQVALSSCDLSSALQAESSCSFVVAWLLTSRLRLQQGLQRSTRSWTRSWPTYAAIHWLLFCARRTATWTRRSPRLTQSALEAKFEERLRRTAGALTAGSAASGSGSWPSPSGEPAEGHIAGQSFPASAGSQSQRHADPPTSNLCRAWVGTFPRGVLYGKLREHATALLERHAFRARGSAEVKAINLSTPYFIIFASAHLATELELTGGGDIARKDSVGAIYVFRTKPDRSLDSHRLRVATVELWTA